MKRAFIGLSLALAAAAWAQPKVAPAASAASPPALCDGCGIVSQTHSEARKGKGSGLGAVGGAVVGGVLGHQIGGGSGKTLATAGGAVAGGVAGHEIEKQMKKHTVWVTDVKLKDGTVRRFESGADPHVAVGDVVQIQGNELRKK